MPTYEYLCNKCEYNFTIIQSIKADSLKNCPECHQDGLERVIHAVPVFSKGEVKTVGQQADFNRKRLGKYGTEDKIRELEESKEKARDYLGSKLPAGTKRKDKNAPKPWWRKTAKVNTALAKIAPKIKVKQGKIVESEPLSKKAMDYLMTGKT